MLVDGLMSDRARSIGDRIRMARGSRSQAELAAAVGVDRMTIGRYEAGKRSPPLEVLEKIADATETDRAWLTTGDGVAPDSADTPPSAIDPDSRAARQRARDAHEEGGRFYVPILGARPAAGAGAEAEDARADWMVVPRAYAARLGVGKHTAVVFVQGDSMTPTLSDGDPVLVDTSATEIRHDAIYVLRIDDALVVKRVQALPNGAVRIASDNARYAPYELSGDGARQLAVVGRVIKGWGDVR